MRVAMVVPLYVPHLGGVQTHVQMLAASLIDCGHEVDIFTQVLMGDRAAGPPERLPRVHHFRSFVPSSRYPMAPGLAVELRRRAHQYSVIHVHGYHGAASMASLVVTTGQPVVFTPHFHGGGHTPFARLLHRFYGPLGRAVVRRSSAVIAVSHAEAGHLTRAFPDASPRIRVIPNGVRVRPRAGNRSKTPVLLTIGRLEAYKRIHIALETTALLPEEWQLHVIGSGVERHNLERLAEKLGLADRVRLSADLDETEMARALSEAWAYISMSEREAFGLTVLEAASAGMPAFVSDIPAHRELATMAPSSVFLTPSTAPAAIAGLLLDHEGRGTDTSWASEVSWESVGRRTAALYEELTAAPGGLRT